MNIHRLDLEYLVNGSLITKDALKYLFGKIDSMREAEAFYLNTSVLEYFLENNIIDIKDLVDKFSDIRPLSGRSSALQFLFDNSTRFFRSFNVVKKDLMQVESFQYALSKFKLHEEQSLINLMNNATLLEFCFSNFLFDEQLIEKFDKILKNVTPMYQRTNKSFFEDIKTTFESNKKLLKLIDMFEQLYAVDNLDVDEKKKTLEIVLNSDAAQEILKQIIESNLEDQYDFESLMRVLTKDDKKTLKTKFNL